MAPAAVFLWCGASAPGRRRLNLAFPWPSHATVLHRSFAVASVLVSAFKLGMKRASGNRFYWKRLRETAASSEMISFPGTQSAPRLQLSERGWESLWPWRARHWWPHRVVCSSGLLMSWLLGLCGTSDPSTSCQHATCCSVRWIYLVLGFTFPASY